MRIRMKVAIVCLALNGALGLAMAARYGLADGFTPYHADAAGVAWASLPPGVQFVILGLMRVAAAGMLGIGLLFLMMIAPVSRYEGWARWTALICGLAFLVPILYLTVSASIATGASYPVVPTALGAVVTIVAFLASRPEGEIVGSKGVAAHASR